jgi:predicted nucleic acid-binding protein
MPSRTVPGAAHNGRMTRYGIDALTAVRLVREGLTVPEAHKVVAPNLLRSQALSLIYREVRRGELGADEARIMLDRLTTMRIRLLGDRVSRATAWKVAEQLGWDDTANAEYVAVAQLQADAFVTLDTDLARAVSGIVTIAPFEALLRAE